ncbi:MAG: CHASE domain-containing protein [bacterium]
MSLRLSGLLTMAISLAVFFGWVYDVEALVRLVPSFSAMNPVTASLFFVWGLALFLSWPRPRRPVCYAAGVLLSAVAAVRLMAEFGWIVFRIDHVMFAEHIMSDGAARSSVSPITAACFLLVGIALLTALSHDRSRAWRWVSVGCYALVGMLGLAGLVGHWAGFLGMLKFPPFLSLAMHTTTLFFAVGLFASMERLRTLVRLSLVRQLVFGIILLATVGVPMVLTLNGWRIVGSYLDRQDRLVFSGRVDHLEHEIMRYLFSHVGTLEGARGLFAASQAVERGEWARYINAIGLDQDLSVIQAIGFSRYVPGDSRRAEELSIQASGAPDFSIFPVGERELYTPIEYIEPFSGSNLTVVGYDMFSDSSRREAMERARDSGHPVMTSRVNLLQDIGDSRQHPGFLIFLPIYRNGLPIDTIEDRRVALEGYVFAAYRADELVTAVKEREGFLDLTVDVYDGSAELPSNLLFDDLEDGSSLDPDGSRLSEVRVKEVFGREWTMHYTSSSGFEVHGTDQLVPLGVLVGGTFFSLLLLVIMYLILASRQRAIGYAELVTADLRRSLVAIARAKARDEAVLAGLSEGLVVISPVGRIEMVNRTLEKMSGWSSAELVGQEICQVIPLLDGQGQVIPREDRPECRAVKDNAPYVSPVDADISLRRKDGSAVLVALMVAPVTVDGETIGSVELFRDVTEERKIERAKTEFVSLASHQLKTPLTAIGWNVEMLLTDQGRKLSVKQRETLEEIAAGNRRMVELVNALLNTSRIDLGTFSIVPQPVSLKAIVANVVSEQRPGITAKKLRFSSRVASGLTRFMADPTLIRMVFDNLLSNAIKYTPPGGHVRLLVDVVGREVVITVEDSGFGIPRGQRDNVFDKMFRADNVVSREISGTGLGLYIVKAVAEQGGGRIWFESEENRGSSFHVAFPKSGMKQRKGSRRLN